MLLLLLINAFQAFDEFYNLLSSSGQYPPYARPPLVYLYYTALGQGQDFGHGSAGAVILTLLIAVIALGQGRVLRPRTAGGLSMAADPPRPAPPGSGTAAPVRRRWCVGAVLFLIPFYLVLRNGLSTEADITAPDWKLLPTTLQWGNIGELFYDPAVPMTRSLRQLGRHRRSRRPSGVLLLSCARRLRPGPHPVPPRRTRSST